MTRFLAAIDVPPVVESTISGTYGGAIMAFDPRQTMGHPTRARARGCGGHSESVLARSQQQSHQLIGAQGEDTEHQVAHHLDRPCDTHVAAAELVFESRVAAFGDGALVVAHGIGRLELDLLAAAPVVVDQRDVPQRAAVLVQFQAAIGRVHHIVEVGHARGADQRQRDGRAAVVHRGRREQCSNRHAAVGGVQVQLVAVPAHLVALGVALGAAIAGGGNLRDHLGQGLAALTLDRGFLGGRADFTLAWSPALLLGPDRDSRSVRLCRGCRREQRQLGTARGRLGARRAARRAFARFDRRAIAAEVPDQSIPQVGADQCFMHALGQLGGRKLGKGSREGRLGRQLAVQREATDASQRPVDRQPFDQSDRRRQPEHRLGDESIRQPGALDGRTPQPAPGRSDEFLDPHPLQNMDDPFELRCQCPHLDLELRQQFILDHAPALHDQFARGSIHGVGVLMMAS